MKYLFLFALLSCLATQANSAPGEYTAYTSPSGRIIARAGIAGAEASPSVRFRLRLVFETATKEDLGEVWTGLRHRWAVTWSDDDVFLVCGINEEADGNPMEFSAENFTGKGKGAHRAPTSSERTKVLQEYRRKYPNKTDRLNQSPATPKSVTTAAGAPVALATSGK
jgi:hypothetical protein